MSADGLRCFVPLNQLWSIVICVVTFSVQPMPSALLWLSKWLYDTVMYWLSLRMSSSPSPMCVSRLWSIQTWSAVSIWIASKSVVFPSQSPST